MRDFSKFQIKFKIFLAVVVDVVVLEGWGICGNTGFLRLARGLRYVENTENFVYKLVHFLWISC